MRFARSGPANQDDIALLRDEAAVGEVAHQSFVDCVPVNSQPSASFASGSLAIVNFY
jgi:hypothetical protein